MKPPNSLDQPLKATADLSATAYCDNLARPQANQRVLDHFSINFMTLLFAPRVAVQAARLPGQR